MSEDSVRNCITRALSDGFLHSFEDLFNISHTSALETNELIFVNQTLLEAEKALNCGEYEKAFGKYTELGRHFKEKESFEWAAHFFEKCRLLGESKIKKVRLLRIAYFELGLVYEKLGKYDDCIENHKLHVRCWGKNGKEVELMDAYKHLYRAHKFKGNELFQQRLHDEALKSLNLAIEAANGARNLLLEGEIYYDMGQLYDSQSKSEECVEAYRKYLKVALELENKQAETRAYYALGNAYRSKKDIILAYNYFKSFLEMTEEGSNIVEKCLAERMMSEILTEMNDHEKALVHSQKNYELCVQRKELKSLSNARVYLGVTEGRLQFSNTSVEQES